MDHLSRRAFLRTSAAGVGSGTALASLVGLGASLTPAALRAQPLRIEDAKATPSVCPYCSVGCATIVHTIKGEIVNIEGDPRSSGQNNLAGEFLGDYVYAAATRDYGVAVWNDSRNGGVCAAINTYRQALHDAVVNGTALPTAPSVQQVCPLDFGDSDIFGGSFADPTP